MTLDLPGALVKEALVVLATVGGPVFGVMLLVGLVVGVLQAATQVNDAAVGFLPRAAAALAVGAPTVESFREGVEVTHRQLTAALEKAGVTEVDPAGQKFDPHRHEAMGQADGGEPNTVATVLRKGYLLNDRVIRPALVMVSRGPAAPGPEGAPGA